MTIYVIGPESGPVKIGYTSSGNPRDRLKSLQTGYPYPLQLLACFPGTVKDERELHNRFSASRIAREWFARSQELTAFMESIGKNIDKANVTGTVHTNLRIPDDELERVEKLRQRIERVSKIDISTHKLLIRIIAIGLDAYEEMLDREEKKR